MSEVFCSPTGNDANPGTQAAPKRDPSLVGEVDALWLEAGGLFVPQQRVGAAKFIGAYGSGAPPRLVSTEIAVSLINRNGTASEPLVVQDLDISGDGCTRGVHVGVSGDDPDAKRYIVLQRIYVHNLLGEGAVGVQSWGDEIKVRHVRIDTTRSDSWWHRGASIDAEQIVMLNPSCLDEGTGDCLQSYVSRRVRLVAVTCDHFVHDKQALLISGNGMRTDGLPVELEECEITGVTIAGWAVGAGLWTVELVRGLVARHCTVSMPRGPANAGIAWINQSSGYLHAGTFVGYEGAIGSRNDATSSGVLAPDVELMGWGT